MYVEPLKQTYISKTDNELLSLYQKGNQSAITALLARYANLINSVASSYYINGADKDDNKQEAYMGLFKAIRSFKPNMNTSFYTYANHCIANQLKNNLAKSSTNKAKVYKNSVSLEEIENYKLPQQTISNPEVIFIQNEGYETLLNLTNTVLSDLEKNVMFLYLSGCDYISIAMKLNSTQKSVDNALQRARRKLKAVLNKL